MVGKKREVDVSHIVVIALGTVILLQRSIPAAVMYVLVSVLGSLWFMARICPHCRAYGTNSCSSGYGMISSRLFRKPEKIDFKRAFSRNIIAVAIQWFIPFLGGIYFLYISFDPYLLITTILFVFVAFVWLPVRSRGKGCARCPQRSDCAWASKDKK